MRLLLLLLLAGLACRSAPEPVRIVADPTLPDVAMSYPESNAIRFNPIIVVRLDPDFVSWALLHEQAHLVYGHRRDTVAATRRRQELVADCWASARADSAWRAAAIRFFEFLGPFRGKYHPTGYQRAAEIERCGR